MKTAATSHLAGLSMRDRSVARWWSISLLGPLLLSTGALLQDRAGMRLMQFRYNDFQLGGAIDWVWDHVSGMCRLSARDPAPNPRHGLNGDCSSAFDKDININALETCRAV